MAYKYKLAEINPTVFPQAAKAALSTVKSVNKGEKIPGEQFGELENILREKGIDEDTITDILDTWAERHLFVNPNEAVDPLHNKMQDLLQRFKDEDEKERKEREEQGRKNLTQEVLRRLKNR